MLCANLDWRRSVKKGPQTSRSHKSPVFGHFYNLHRSSACKVMHECIPTSMSEFALVALESRLSAKGSSLNEREPILSSSSTQHCSFFRESLVEEYTHWLNKRILLFLEKYALIKNKRTLYHRDRTRRSWTGASYYWRFWRLYQLTKVNASEVRGQLTKTKRFLTWHQSFNGTVGTRK